jgi:hypothetical protein
MEIWVIAKDDDEEPDKSIPDRNYTVDEIVAGFHALDAVERGRLRGISKSLARIVGMQSEELLNEAFLRMLSTRTCPVNVSIIAFAVETMKSIVSTTYRKQKKIAADGATFVPIAANDGGVDVTDDTVSPEDEALSRIFYGECLDRVEALIADDEELQLLVMGICDGLFGRDLEQALDTDTKGLAAARKRLANRLRKAFGKSAPL